MLLVLNFLLSVNYESLGFVDGRSSSWIGEHFPLVSIRRSISPLFIYVHLRLYPDTIISLFKDQREWFVFFAGIDRYRRFKTNL